MDKELLKKYGLPTAFASAAFAAMLWLMQVIVSQVSHKIDALGDDVAFLSGMIDYSCQPVKGKPVHKAAELPPTPPVKE
jgi:hypothetical protein